MMHVTNKCVFAGLTLASMDVAQAVKPTNAATEGETSHPGAHAAAAGAPDLVPNLYFPESDTNQSFFLNLNMVNKDGSGPEFDMTKVQHALPDSNPSAKEKFVMWTATFTIQGILDAVKLTGGKPGNVTLGTMPYNYKTLFPYADDHIKDTFSNSSFENIKQHAETYYKGAKIAATYLKTAEGKKSKTERKMKDFENTLVLAVYDELFG
jgi:hypothetical protein